MPFLILFQDLPKQQMRDISARDKPRAKKLRKALALLESDPRHPGLNSHRYADYDSLYGERIWESYVENRTPGAYRVFWHYGPDPNEITIVAITPHP